MALPSVAKCCVLAPLLLLLAAGLFYTGCLAFRIRDNAPATNDDAASAAASQVGKGVFQKVSLRGGFAKGKVKVGDDKARSWSKLNKIEDLDDLGSLSGDDQDESDEVQIEVEDDDSVIESEEEDIKLKEKLRQEEEEKKKREEKEKKKKEKAEEDRRKKEKELEEKKRKEEEERKRKEKEREEKRKREEAEKLLKEEAERKLREIEERKRMEAEERKRKEEEERKRKEEEERKRREEEERKRKQEEDRKRREEEERKRKEEEERKRKEEEEQKRKEEQERKRKEEKETRIKEEKELKQREEEERKKKEEEEKKRKEEEERKRKEEEEKKKKEEEKRRLEEERKRKEEEKRLREAEEKKKREEEERRKQQEERIKKEKEAVEKRRIEEEKLKKEREELEAEKKRIQKAEEERKRKEKEKTDAEKKRDQERIERLKKEAEQKKLREEAERKKKSKPKKDKDKDEDEEEEDDNDEADNGNGSNGSLETQTKAKSVSKNNSKSNSAKKQQTSPNKSKPKSRQRRSSDGPLSLGELNDMLLSVPTFVPNFTAVEDLACQQHGKIFLRQLRGYKMWALQMLDSSAKIPAGLLRGNVNQLGDFDQCLGITARVKVEKEKTVRIQGKYCLASMDLYPTHTTTKLPVNLMQSRALVRGSMRDPGHFIPKFTTVNWALCLPAACSARDARRSIEEALLAYNMTVGIRFQVDVDPDMCYVKQKAQSYSKETIGVLYFYAIFICLAVVATLRDYFATTQEKGSYSERIIMAFSLKRTLRALFGNREISSCDIGCIHGIRTLSTIALYAAHKLIPTSRIPYANRVSLTEVASHPLSVMLRASLFYTDSFLLLSGVLTAFNMAKELTIRGEIRWFCRLIARYMRLTPALLAIVFWYAYVMEHTGSGPQWNSAVKSNADICKENSWINLLYVQNFFPFEEMCATHTHQLALDMQLFLIAPALVFFLQIKPIIGIIIIFFILQVSATLRYFAVSNNNLSLVIFHGMTLKHLYKTANLTYSLPLHRASPYLFGVTLGVILHNIGKNMKIHRIFRIIGWTIAIAAGSWSLFSQYDLARRDYVYSVEDATHYAVISPILTAVALGWVIFACFTNNGGFVNKFLSNYWMLLFSRLSYAIYLSQFVVFFYNVGVARYSSEFQTNKIIDLYELLCVLSVSVAITLIFDIPMQEVKNIIMECSDSSPVSVEQTETRKESLVPQENHKNHVSKKISQDLTTEEEDETTMGNWNWNRGTFTRSEPREYFENGLDDYRNGLTRSLRRVPDYKRNSLIRSEAYDEWDNRRSSRSEEHSVGDERRRSRSDYRLSDVGLEDDDERYLHPRERHFSGSYTRSPMRDLDAPVYRRSTSRDRFLSASQDISRDYGKKPLITISPDDDYQPRSPRSSIPRYAEQQRSMSSESELETYSSRRSNINYNRRSSTEPRIADEEEWEEELRLRRNRFLQEKVNSQERDRVPPPVPEEEVVNNEWDQLKRRSSAEGKMALLKEPIRPGNMDLWTVSKLQLGSSQEPDDEEYNEEMYLQQRREYREKGPPLKEEFEEEDEVNGEQVKSYASESLPTSFEEEDDANNLDFSLKQKMITVQDLSKLPSEDEPASWNKLDVKAGLFKRESIVKSQASEEDPEYLLPERPKLVEQEQEHPFKKAWQMQKSRSEEEGPGNFIVKETKSATTTLEKQKEEPEETKPEKEKDKQQNGEQFAGIPESDVTCEVTLVLQAHSNDVDDAKSTSTKCQSSSSSSSSSSSISRSSSLKFDWPGEEEEFQHHKNRRQSDDENWTWTERDT